MYVLTYENKSTSDFVLCRYTFILVIETCVDIINRIYLYTIPIPLLIYVE